MATEKLPSEYESSDNRSAESMRITPDELRAHRELKAARAALGNLIVTPDFVPKAEGHVPSRQPIHTNPEDFKGDLSKVPGHPSNPNSIS